MARDEASLRCREWPRRRPDVEPEEVCENEGDVSGGFDVGGGAGWWEPVAFRFFGELWYSERKWDAWFCEYGDSCWLFPDGVGGSLLPVCDAGGTQW